MNTSGKVWTITLVSITVLGVGLFTSIVLSHRIDRNQRAALLREAQQAALLVPSSSVSMLSATSADIQNPLYQTIKQNLMAFRSYNSSTRFVYVLGYKPELRTQFFYVDSEPIESKDYSPPGQLFPDTRQRDIDQYLSGQAYTDGPYGDSWGEWVSGYAPIKDAQGTTVALVGIDTATSVWHEQIGFVRSVVGAISVLAAIVVSLLIIFVHKKQRSIDLLQKENRTLAHTEGKLKELQTMAQIGRLVLYFPDQTFSVDGELSQVVGVSGTNRLERKAVEAFIHHDDLSKLETLIQEITDTDSSYGWADIRLGTQEKGFRTYHIYGNIERNELLAPVRFSGIIQDITDIHTS